MEAAVSALAVAERRESTLAPRIRKLPRVTALVSTMTIHCGWPMLAALDCAAASMVRIASSVRVAEGAVKGITGPVFWVVWGIVTGFAMQGGSHVVF